VSRVIPARGSQENDGVVVGSDGFSVHCLKACAVSLLGATRCWPRLDIQAPPAREKADPIGLSASSAGFAGAHTRLPA